MKPDLRMLGSICLAFFGLIFCAEIVAQDDRGSSARNIRLEAAEGIPFDQLTPDAQQRTRQVLNSASVYRRMPITTIAADPDLYLFCVRYPEIIVDIWRLMGVSEMTAQRTGPFTLATNDGAGTTCKVELIYGTPTVHIFLATGRYAGARLLKPIEGTALIILKTDYSRDATGESQATSCLDVFLDIENSSAEWVARIIYPLFGGTADHNFVESLRFLEKLSSTTYDNGPGVQGMARKLTGVHPEVRSRFSQIVAMVYERHFYQDLAHSANPSKGDDYRQVQLRQ